MRKGLFNQAFDLIVKLFKTEESLDIAEIETLSPQEDSVNYSEECPDIDISQLNLSPEQMRIVQDKIQSLRNKYILNNLIPADELHWNDHDQKYCAISEQDLDRIILTCHENGASEEVMQALVKEFVEYKTSKLLFKQFFRRNIGVYHLKDGKPFYEKIKADTN